MTWHAVEMTLLEVPMGPPCGAAAAAYARCVLC